MVAPLNSSNRKDKDKVSILCCYTNTTSKLQIIRVKDTPHGCFERVVVPHQRLFFEAFPEAELEIHTGTPITAILSEKMTCVMLQVERRPHPVPEREISARKPLATSA